MGNKNLSARIHEGVQKIYVTDNLVKKFDKMLATKRGRSIVKDIDRLGMDDIISKYQVPYMRKFGSNGNIREVMRNRIKAHYNIIDYTNIGPDGKLHKPSPPKEFKHVKSPQPKNWTGDQKKYQKKPMGLAAYLHALEEHKMDRWNRRHQMPSLEFDLFPELIVAGWKTKMQLARENIRNMLSLRYCRDKRYKPQWRFFGVYKDIKTGHIFEHEPDPSVIGYPGVRLGDDATNAKIVDILDLYKPKAKQSCGKDTICIKVKMYSADGSRWVSRDAA